MNKQQQLEELEKQKEAILKEIEEQKEIKINPGGFFVLGRAYHIETVTKYFYGVVEGFSSEGFVILKNAAWIADTGRYSEAMRKDSTDYKEIEKIENCIAISVQTIVSVVEKPLIILSTK